MRKGKAVFKYDVTDVCCFSLQLKQELGNFGPDFFEEIEDLKFNYREAVQKNVELEDKLHKLSRQYGFSVNFVAAL